MILKEAIETVHQQFLVAPLVYGHGTDNAWDEAVALVLTLLEIDDDQERLADPVTDRDWQRILELTRQRIEQRVPLAYLLKRCRYMGLTFALEPGVVVPRSPIGPLLAESAWAPEQPETIVDLCAGSGCLGIVAAHIYPQSRVWLVEQDTVALQVARRNVADHKLGDRVQVIAGDVTQPLNLPAADLLITNPPYVDALDMASLPAEYRAEPAAGLAAGEDGLSVINAILAQLDQRLTPGGRLIAEVGASAPALLRRHPDLPIHWPQLPDGGEGVFVIDAEDLHTARR